MENLTVSLDTAKKLKAAGFPQEQPPYIWWDIAGREYVDLRSNAARFAKLDEAYAAPTAQEIADHLQRMGIEQQRAANIEMNTQARGWQVWLADNKGYGLLPDSNPEDTLVYGDTMAEALAALWLRLNPNNKEERENE